MHTYCAMAHIGRARRQERVLRENGRPGFSARLINISQPGPNGMTRIRTQCEGRLELLLWHMTCPNRQPPSYSLLVWTALNDKGIHAAAIMSRAPAHREAAQSWSRTPPPVWGTDDWVRHTAQ
jgi:hypothetical protein